MVVLLLEERRILLLKGLVGVENEGRPFKLIIFKLVSSVIGLQQSNPIFPFASLPDSDFGSCWPAPIKFLCISQNLMNGWGVGLDDPQRVPCNPERSV